MCYTGACPYERPYGPTDTVCMLPEGRPCPDAEGKDDSDNFEEYDEETPRVQVGKFSISRQAENSVWIEVEGEEGGEFQDDLLEKCLEDFFNKHF